MSPLWLIPAVWAGAIVGFIAAALLRSGKDG